MLLFPGFVVASTVWSESPAETFKHSLEFSTTVVAALLLASSRNPRAMLLALFTAFLLYTVVSAIFGNRVDVGNYGARALSGLGESKNEAADIAAIGFVISTFLALTALHARQWLQFAVAVPTAALQVYVATAAMSSGAITGMAAALLGLLLLLLLRRAGKASRAIFLGVGSTCAFALAAAFELSGGSIPGWLGTFFDKDPTLTGRTYLWFSAKELVAEHPYLGRGFGAFWQQGNLDAEGLWQFAQITSRQGFNFHSTLYDTLVSLGWAGAAILGFTFLIALGRVALDYIARPTLLSCFWLSMAACLFIRMPTECVGLIEFYFSTVLLFACFGSVKPMPVLAKHCGDATPGFAVAHLRAASAATRFVAS
jgi:exopolysaccharide production protein ExoQ